MTMKSKRAAALLLIAPLLLSGCAEWRHEESAPYELVYFALKETENNLGELIQSEKIAINDESKIISEKLDALFHGPSRDDLRSPFPHGTKVLSYSLKNGEITIELSEEYGMLSGIDEIIADYCIVLTLCSVDEILFVTIRVAGEIKKNRMTSDDVMAVYTEVNPYEKQISLYFPDGENRYLVPETHTLVLGKDTLLVRMVIEELLNGSAQRENSPIPAGTRLLGISLEDGVCTVNFSSEFFANRPDTLAKERITVYSIVNSLTSITGVDSVSILVEGVSHERYVYLFLDKPLGRNEEIIRLPELAGGTIDITLYVRDYSGKRMIGIPTIIIKEEYSSLPHTIMEELINADKKTEQENLFPEGTRVLSVILIDHVCRINLSDEFIGEGTPKELERIALAIQAMALSAGNMEGIDAAQVMVDGKKVTIDGVSLYTVVYMNENLVLK